MTKSTMFDAKYMIILKRQCSEYKNTYHLGGVISQVKQFIGSNPLILPITIISGYNDSTHFSNRKLGLREGKLAQPTSGGARISICAVLKLSSCSASQSRLSLTDLKFNGMGLLTSFRLGGKFRDMYPSVTTKIFHLCFPGKGFLIHSPT